MIPAHPAIRVQIGAPEAWLFDQRCHAVRFTAELDGRRTDDRLVIVIDARRRDDFPRMAVETFAEVRLDAGRQLVRRLRGPWQAVEYAARGDVGDLTLRRYADDGDLTAFTAEALPAQ